MVVGGGVKVAGRWGEGVEVEVAGAGAVEVDATAEGGEGYLICTPAGIEGAADDKG